MVNRFDRYTPAGRFLSFMAITAGSIGAFTVLVGSLQLGVAGLILGVIFGIPIAFLAASIFVPIASAVSALPWAAGHWIGNKLNMQKTKVGVLAGSLAAVSWTAFANIIAWQLSRNPSRGQGDPLPTSNMLDTLFDVIVFTSWGVPIVGFFVAYWIYDDDE